jgi:hypothetical protein
MAKISDMLASGVGGVLPMLMAKDYNKQRAADKATTAADEARQQAAAASAQGQPMKKGGKVSSASSRADGCAQRGKTKGKMV